MLLSQSFAETIVACVPAIVVRLDTGIIIAATPMADHLFGYIDGELAGKQLSDLIPERFRQVHSQHFQRYGTTPARRAMGEVQMQLIARHMNGTEFPVEIGLHPRVVEGFRCVVAALFRSRSLASPLGGNPNG